MVFSDIDFTSPEDDSRKKRPFVVNVEEDVARAFISAVKGRGLFVRETVVKLMRAFAEDSGHTSLGVKNGNYGSRTRDAEQWSENDDHDERW